MTLRLHKLGRALGSPSDSRFEFFESPTDYSNIPSLADELGLTIFTAVLQCLTCGLTGTSCHWQA
jgi:hypothetical protein